MIKCSEFLQCELISLITGTAFGALWTFTFFILSEDHLREWFTSDSTLQYMMLDLVPMACIANITMSIGMLCWSLLGAQGRYRLATLITFLSGWLVTVPLGAIFVYACNFDLSGLVAAVSIGYSVSGTVLMYLLVRTNWDKRIAKVRRATSLVWETESPTEKVAFNGRIKTTDIDLGNQEQDRSTTDLVQSCDEKSIKCQTSHHLIPLI